MRTRLVRMQEKLLTMTSLTNAGPAAHQRRGRFPTRCRVHRGDHETPGDLD